MRKIIIAICGIILACGAMGAEVPSWLPEPKKTQVSPWWNASNSFSETITDFYPDVNTEFADDKNHVRHGTYDDEGAIIIWAARKIYDKGAEFCPVQIQAANKNGKYWVWLDYYWNNDDDVWKNCKTVCVKGYTGPTCGILGNETCSTTSTPTTQGGGLMGHGPTVNQGYFTGLPKWTNLRPEYPSTVTNGQQPVTQTIYAETGTTYRHTTEMEVISYTSKYGTDDEDRKTDHVVLGVVGKVAHGIKVAPIKIVGQRSTTGGGIKSWIKSANSNTPVLLCYDGYVPNSNATACECNNDNQSSNGWCSGWSEPTSHTENYITYKDGTCQKYTCVDGYGLDDNKTCISCPTTKTQGVNPDTGVCIKCTNPNEMFDGTECKQYTQLSTLQLKKGFQEIFDCWQEFGGNNYKTCVLCKSSKSYNKTTKTCN